MRNRAAILLLVLTLAASCSSGSGEGERSLVGDKGDKKSSSNGKAGKGEEQKKKKKKIDDPADVTDTLPSGDKIKRDQDGYAAGLAPPEPQFATGSAFVQEPEPDAETTGVPPDYTEMMSVGVEGLGKNFRITMSFASEVPQQMPKDTFMIVGFGLWRGDDREHGHSFTAQATEEGWRPYSGAKAERTKFPGKFEVVANQVVMTIPWSYVDGPYEFNWGSTSGWFQQVAGGAATTTAFDPIPNEDEAHYPN